MITLEQFKTKHKDLFDLGVCEIRNNSDFTQIVIDRFVDGNFLCDYNALKPAQNDARKMGYKNFTIGVYVKFKSNV